MKLNDLKAKTAVALGCLSLVFSAWAKDVYYVSGYFGMPGKDAASFTVKDAEGNDATYEAGDTVIIGTHATGTEAWISDDDWLPKLIKIEKNFTLHSGVANEVLSGITVEIASDCTLSLNKGNSANVIKVGEVVFCGDGTVDLLGVASVADPLTISAGTKFILPDIYKGGIVIVDPENIDPADYPDYVIYRDADGKAQLMLKTDVVAYVGETPYRTLQTAFDAAKPSGSIRTVGWPTADVPSALKDALQWSGTITFSGAMPNGFSPSNYGNTGSTIEFKGVSGGYLVSGGSFEGTLKLANDGSEPGFVVKDGYSSNNFVFGGLSGDGDLVGEGTVTQQYSFQDVSRFAGNVTSGEKRFVIGSAAHNKVGRIYVENGMVATVASGKTWDGKWTVRIDGTVKGSGTLKSSGHKRIYFGYDPDLKEIDDADPTIDLSEGALTVDSSCGVTFGKTLTLKSAHPGDVILNCAQMPTNMGTVTLKDETGATPDFWSLTYADGAVKLAGDTKVLKGEETWTVSASEYAAFPEPLLLDLTDYDIGDRTSSIGETPHGLIMLPAGTSTEETQAIIDKILLVSPKWHRARLVADGNEIKLTADTMTIFWSAWRGTFWEHYGQADANGNHGLGRALDGTIQAILSGDTVVFDKDHYTADGVFAEQTDYWHYDENLYVKDDVRPGTSNDWDLKVLQGVTLKMGLRGARATGQNVISNLKIFVDADSSLEFGYWGNTHHYQGVIRDGVVFGGAGMIVFGEDLGPSLKAEGNILVNGDETPVMNLNGKELVLAGTNAEIDVALTGFGSITPTAAGIHLMGNVNFGNAATIDASNAANMLTIDKSATFGANLTVKLTTAPAEDQSALVLALGENATLALQTTDVRVLVDGKPVAAFYELFQNDDDGNLYVRVKETPVVYTTSVSEGYDFAGGLVTVTMDPAIADLPVTVAIKNDKGVTVRKDGEDWTGAMVVGPQGAGSATVMAGDEDHLLAAGKYSYTVTVGEKSYEGSFFVGNTWFAADAASGASDVFNGAWQTAPLIADHHYQISGEATFDVASDKAAGELGVVEHAVRFTSAADVETLEDFEDLQANAIGAITLAEGVASEQSEEPGVRWVGSVNGEWVELAGVAATQGDHMIRMEFDRSGETAKMRYLVDGVALTATATDAGGWFELCRGESSVAAAEATFSSVSYVGAGGLERLTGFVDDLSLAEYNGVKYQTMAEAVAAWTANGKTGAITLLTNVYFAPEPGTYEIAKNGFKLYMTNDMKILSESGTTVVIGFPTVVEGLTTAEDGYPVVIAGEWLGHAIPWKTRKDVRRELWNKPEGSDFTWWQSYVLGIAADKAATAKAPFVFAAASDDPNTVTFDDGLSPKNERETGVVVTRKLVGGSTLGLEEAVEATYDELRRPVFDLGTMADRVQYLRLQYDFKADLGQELP